MSEEKAYEFVIKTLEGERIEPYKDDELEIVRSVENCINCGLCTNHCPVVGAVGLDRFSGPRSIAVELSRSPPEFWSTADKIYLCTGCGTCREVCPKNVNIPDIVQLVRARIFRFRPDLVPKGLYGVREIILEHDLAFEPWEDIEDKEESRDMRLDRLNLPLIPDVIKDSAKILFYPGCQAEERAQEVREAGKLILSHFGADFTMLDEMSCCGLPVRLIGDDAKSRELALKLKGKVKETGVEMVVTTCAGCTSNLNDMAKRDNWGIPVYHILEYLVEEIGLERVAQELRSNKVPSSKLRVALHDPCHLIRHTSRQIAGYALDVIATIPGVEIAPSRVSDSCCGGGGMVSYHSSDVANSVTEENVLGITETEASHLVTPCPLCTAQIENRLFKAGSSIEVDDLSVFIAQRLPLKR